MVASSVKRWWWREAEAKKRERERWMRERRWIRERETNHIM